MSHCLTDLGDWGKIVKIAEVTFSLTAETTPWSGFIVMILY